jgi:AcrR family transcriptional regulator
MRSAREPQRRNGKRRVAAILKAATAVIAEQGYEAATMAEIAARSDTQIGSLYRFFPNKESLANAMMARYRENIDIVFDKIDERIASLSIPALADALLATVLELHKQGAALKLMDANRGWSAKREELRGAALKRIAQTLMLCSPRLSASLARDMAFVVLHNMKAMVALFNLTDRKARAGAIRELRGMTQLYLKSRLKKAEP